jgi:hypothetical protein
VISSLCSHGSSEQSHPCYKMMQCNSVETNLWLILTFKMTYFSNSVGMNRYPQVQIGGNKFINHKVIVSRSKRWQLVNSRHKMLSLIWIEGNFGGGEASPLIGRLHFMGLLDRSQPSPFIRAQVVSPSEPDTRRNANSSQSKTPQPQPKRLSTPSPALPR